VSDLDALLVDAEPSEGVTLAGEGLGDVETRA